MKEILFPYRPRRRGTVRCGMNPTQTTAGRVLLFWMTAQAILAEIRMAREQWPFSEQSHSHRPVGAPDGGDMSSVRTEASVHSRTSRIIGSPYRQDSPKSMQAKKELASCLLFPESFCLPPVELITNRMLP
ncbi:hypothetical protein BDW62DRAFT_137814 [Aspergillus aurantiobrunneus]